MWLRPIGRHENITVMSLEESRRTQKPYRYGMILLCVGALINWVGLADNYPEAIRYIGVACIIGGALLICAAMCCWLHTPTRTATTNNEIDDPIHVITINDEISCEKPPDYDTVDIAPPSYDDAIKLNPANLILVHHQLSQSSTSSSILTTTTSSSVVRPSSSSLNIPLSYNNLPGIEQTRNSEGCHKNIDATQHITR